MTPETASATPWAWRSSLEGWRGDPLSRGLLAEDAESVARKLLGTCLRSTADGVETTGVIVETEAYVGPHDPASHAAERIGRTRRNESMFGSPGLAYVYRIYGIHWCLNVVTGQAEYPAAVLIRGIDPIVGEEVMARRRGGRTPLGAGPGRVTQALGVTGAMDGHALSRPPLELVAGWSVPEERVAISGRVGVRNAADWPLRFFLRGHPEVSKGPS